VIVHLQSSMAGGAPENETSSAPLVKLDRISAITPKDIYDSISAAPPLQRKDVANRYKGLKVEWDTSLRSANESRLEEGAVRLRLRYGERFDYLSVICTVRLSEYKELGILPEGSSIRVYGEIEEANQFDVELKDVRLTYLAPKGTPQNPEAGPKGR
jgi:hypothetical protein